jgi:hypothetical protein
MLPADSPVLAVMGVVDAGGYVVFWFWLLCGFTMRMSVRESLRWWLCVDIYYEIRPFIMPYLAFDSIFEFLDGGWIWLDLANLVFVGLWWWLIQQDPPDPRDRWGKRKRAVKRILTPAPLRKPVSVRPSAMSG